MSPRTRFSAGSCVCGSRSRATAPVTTPCCWRRRHRRVRAIGWSNSAPASAPRALRSPGASPGSSSFWSRSMQVLAALARDNAPPNAIAAEVVVLDVASDRRCFCRRRAWPRQRRRRPDESAVQRFRAAPRVAGQGARDRACGDAATLESWIHAARRILKSGGVADADLARRRTCGGAGGARSRLRQPGDLAGSWRCGDAGDPRAGSRDQGRKAPTADPSRRLMLNDESAVPNKQGAGYLAGKGVLPLAIP